MNLWDRTLDCSGVSVTPPDTFPDPLFGLAGLADPSTCALGLRRPQGPEGGLFTPYRSPPTLRTT